MQTAPASYGDHRLAAVNSATAAARHRLAPADHPQLLALPACPPARLPACQQVSHQVTHVIFDMDGLLLGASHSARRPISAACFQPSARLPTAWLLAGAQAAQRFCTLSPSISISCLHLASLAPADTEGFYTTVQQNLCRRFGKTFDWGLKAKVRCLGGGQLVAAGWACRVLGAGCGPRHNIREVPHHLLACEGKESTESS
jgi:hypothetical protein